ncbi:PepSY domain-containing protein [Pseudoduganella sp. DS3]|uniref:PepSY domain-containing protein n=1 Tax=Pseudoduganella guangdongensis TaxID=2692179 RepID=A0A6N9HNZ8_9BURK|nr:PepSY-associated TM helix domain-containing protein [Pseudoduganella guangdongensis]MYN05007.1 PepSY domain-containing protein [Pseudoduganella guangdongensis]
MKAATLRNYMALHTWSGLLAGFGLFIAFFAGALTVFHEELEIWETPSARTAPMDSTAKAQQLIDAFLAAHPEGRKTFALGLPTEAEPALRISYGAHGHAREFRLSPQGALVEEQPASELAHLLYRLHYTAGLPEAWGGYVLGVVCVLYGLALVSGVVLYAPGFLKDLFALRVGKNLKRMWQDAHNAIGILSLPFHIMFAWSSAVLALGVLLMAPFQYLVFEGKLLNLVQDDIALSVPVKASGTPAAVLPAPELLAGLERAAPGTRFYHLRYHHIGDAAGQVEAYGAAPAGQLTRLTAIVASTSDGRIKRLVTPQNASPGNVFLRGLQTLHFGNFGGYALKWVYFVLGMAGAFLFYSGNLLWIESRRKRQGLQKRSARLMAGLTLGLCLGSVAGIGALLLVNKTIGGVQAEEYAYYGVFGVAVLWALVRPPARAAHELLWTCALLCAALPFTQWWRSGVDPFSAALAGQWIMLGAAGIATSFALGFARMARAVLRRGLQGDPASVWSLQAPPRAAAAQTAGAASALAR